MGKTSDCQFSPGKLSLPKLPVPELKNTMDKYLTLMKTVVSAQEFARTKSLVVEFCKQDLGQKIQEQLIKRQQTMDNWAYDWWLHDMYLNVKLPLIINSNPAAVFPYQHFLSHHCQIRFATKFVCGMLDFKYFLDTKAVDLSSWECKQDVLRQDLLHALLGRRTLPIEKCKYKEEGQPLCMEQHYRLFSSYREPGTDKDLLRTDLGSPGTDFIIVACRNQFFKVAVQDGGEYLSESDISVQLSHVVSMAEENDKFPEVGVLTSVTRDMWAQYREHLLQDPSNRASLNALENCLFILCLDKATLPSCDSCHEDGGLLNDMTARTHHIIHGKGVSNNTANRWMDKTLQLIVSEDGTCGINMEHSVAEGIALGHMIEHVFNFMLKENEPSVVHDIGTLHYPEHLHWNLSSQSVAHIQIARVQVDRIVDNFDLSVFRFEGYGRDFIKSVGFSPDAYIQLALQLTYYKIHRMLTSTYESASLRRFRQGRVDVIRANSPATLTWIRAMLDQTENSEEDKLRLFIEAIHWLQNYTKDTVLGQGIDLHMLGLREAAKEMEIPEPDIFKDPSYKIFNTFCLSTSQVPTVSDYWMGYGAVVPFGYGCCYNPQSDHVTFSVASFFSCPDTSSDMFANTLESSLLQMAELCTHDHENVTLSPR